MISNQSNLPLLVTMQFFHLKQFINLIQQQEKKSNILLSKNRNWWWILVPKKFMNYNNCNQNQYKSNGRESQPIQHSGIIQYLVSFHQSLSLIINSNKVRIHNSPNFHYFKLLQTVTTKPLLQKEFPFQKDCCGQLSVNYKQLKYHIFLSITLADS